MHTVSIKESFRFGWNAFKKDVWVYIGSTAVALIVSMVISKMSDELGDGLFSALISIAGTVLTWWLFLGLTRMALNSYASLPVKFDMIFKESWNVLWRYALTAIVSLIIVGIGLILLIVPGIIAQVMLSLAAFLVLEKSMKPIDALKESRRMTKGKRWDLFLFLLVLVLINIIGMIPAGLGLLVTLPVSLLAFTHVYKAIDKSDDMAPVAPTQMPPATSTGPVV